MLDLTNLFVYLLYDDDVTVVVAFSPSFSLLMFLKVVSTLCRPPKSASLIVLQYLLLLLLMSFAALCEERHTNSLTV